MSDIHDLEIVTHENNNGTAVAEENLDTVNNGGQGPNPVEEIHDSSNSTAEGLEYGAAHSAIQEAKRKLIDSKVVHMGITFSDSDKMTAVKKAIPSLDEELQKTIPNEEGAFQKALEIINQKYNEVIDACTAYVGNITQRGRGKSKSGALRVQLTKEVLAHTVKEQGVFQTNANEFFKEHGQEGKPWTEVLYQTRAKDMRDGAKDFKLVAGGALSTVHMRNFNGKKTYIKNEETLTWEGTRDSAIESYLSLGAEKGKEIVEMYKAAEKSLGSDISDVWDCVAKAHDEPVNEKGNYKNSDGYKHFVEERRKDFLNRAITFLGYHAGAKTFLEEGNNKNLVKAFLSYVYRKQNEFEVATTEAGIARGSVISNRNVSTSRVAESLGAGDVVAKSETILMRDDKGQILKANEMEDAGEKTIDDCLVSAARAKPKVDVEYTPLALKQAWQLQVLDLICGQVDRHINNYACTYRYDKKNGRLFITSVKGFDNDMSFGTKTLSELNKGANVKMLIDRGKISIPFLPKEFYDRIMTIDPKVIAHEQLDIRSKAEIKALLERLRAVKAQLQKLYKAGKLTLVENEDGWREAARTFYTYNDAGEYANSYVVLKA